MDGTSMRNSNVKTLPTGSRFKRRKPVPSFGTPRPNKTNENVSERTNLLERKGDIRAAENQASENQSFIIKSDGDTYRTECGTTPGKDYENNEKKCTNSKLKPRFTPNLNRVKRTKTENEELARCDKGTGDVVKEISMLSFEKISSMKCEEEGEVNVTENQKQWEGVKSKECSEDEHIHKLEKEGETVSSFTKPANRSRFLSSLTSSVTKDQPNGDIENEGEETMHSTDKVNLSETQKGIKNEEGKVAVIKTPRRARFKPNIVPKNNRNDTKRTSSAKSASFEMDKESYSNEDDVSKDETDFDKSSERKVRFMPDNDEEFSKNKESRHSYGEEYSGLGNSEQEAYPTKAQYSHSRSYSDTEDGSQSEGEGIHHHSKRKFAPCLGPSVRQRRRLSSMTMSEDEGHMSDKNTQDKARSSSEQVSEGGSAINKALEIVIENDAKAVSRAEPKKQKRKRIIINEPKEKMTMFDYIYYNPKGTEEEKAEREAENEQEKKRTKRLHEESTRVDESEIVLGSVNGDDTMNSTSTATDNETKEEVGAGNSVDGDKDDNDDNDDIIAPQIKIGEDGQIIIDEQSLTLKTTRSKISLEGSEIVYNDDFDPYWRRNEPKRKKRWPVEDTLKFYKVLGRIGTDFSLMTQFFPDCTRRVLKKKFKTEEKFNGDLIDRALKNMLPMDAALFAELQQNKEQIVYNTNTFTGAQRGRRAANKAKKENQKTKEQDIVREEIINMEVAENVTL